MRGRIIILSVSALLIAIAVATPGTTAQVKHQNAVIDLWAQGKPVFGVYVPSLGQPLWSEPLPPPAANRGGRGGGGRGGPPPARPDPVYTREIGEALAKDPLVDFAFLNLEGGYDASGAKAIIDGLRSPAATHRVTLLVRIPSIQDAGADKTRVRVKQLLDMGADGVTHPENRGLDDAKLVVSFFQDAKADVWSPSNPRGEKLAMIMLEDPAAVLQAKEVADMRNFSIMACGIGSLGGAFRQGGIVNALVSWELLPQSQASQLNELGTQKLLAESKRVGIPNMLTASAAKDENGVPNVVKRVREGFLALLMSGPGSDEAIKLGRQAAGR
jgi:hypothetical protein